MSYRYLDTIATADIAFEANGATLEALFTAAAEAFLDITVRNSEKLECNLCRYVELQDEDEENLLFDFLQELIFLKDSKQLCLRANAGEMRIEETTRGRKLCATLRGDKLNPHKYEIGADVKAVTFHHFHVGQVNDQWLCTVVLDI